jgi:hypothetical protein
MAAAHSHDLCAATMQVDGQGDNEQFEVTQVRDTLDDDLSLSACESLVSECGTHVPDTPLSSRSPALSPVVVRPPPAAPPPPSPPSRIPRLRAALRGASLAPEVDRYGATVVSVSSESTGATHSPAAGQERELFVRAPALALNKPGQTEVSDSVDAERVSSVRVGGSGGLLVLRGVQDGRGQAAQTSVVSCNADQVTQVISCQPPPAANQLGLIEVSSRAACVQNSQSDCVEQSQREHVQAGLNSNPKQTDSASLSESVPASALDGPVRTPPTASNDTVILLSHGVEAARSVLCARATAHICARVSDMLQSESRTVRQNGRLDAVFNDRVARSLADICVDSLDVMPPAGLEGMLVDVNQSGIKSAFGKRAHALLEERTAHIESQIDQSAARAGTELSQPVKIDRSNKRLASTLLLSAVQTLAGAQLTPEHGGVQSVRPRAGLDSAGLAAANVAAIESARMLTRSATSHASTAPAGHVLRRTNSTPAATAAADDGDSSLSSSSDSDPDYVQTGRSRRGQQATAPRSVRTRAARHALPAARAQQHATVAAAPCSGGLGVDPYDDLVDAQPPDTEPPLVRLDRVLAGIDAAAAVCDQCTCAGVSCMREEPVSSEKLQCGFRAALAASIGRHAQPQQAQRICADIARGQPDLLNLAQDAVDEYVHRVLASEVVASERELNAIAAYHKVCLWVVPVEASPMLSVYGDTSSKLVGVLLRRPAGIGHYSLACMHDGVVGDKVKKRFQFDTTNTGREQLLREATGLAIRLWAAELGKELRASKALLTKLPAGNAPPSTSTVPRAPTRPPHQSPAAAAVVLAPAAAVPAPAAAAAPAAAVPVPDAAAAPPTPSTSTASSASPAAPAQHVELHQLVRGAVLTGAEDEEARSLDSVKQLLSAAGVHTDTIRAVAAQRSPAGWTVLLFDSHKEADRFLTQSACWEHTAWQVQAYSPDTLTHLRSIRTMVEGVTSAVRTAVSGLGATAPRMPPPVVVTQPPLPPPPPPPRHPQQHTVAEPSHTGAAQQATAAAHRHARDKGGVQWCRFFVHNEPCPYDQCKFYPCNQRPATAQPATAPVPKPPAKEGKRGRRRHARAGNGRDHDSRPAPPQHREHGYPPPPPPPPQRGSPLGSRHAQAAPATPTPHGMCRYWHRHEVCPRDDCAFWPCSERAHVDSHEEPAAQLKRGRGPRRSSSA